MSTYTGGRAVRTEQGRNQGGEEGWGVGESAKKVEVESEVEEERGRKSHLVNWNIVEFWNSL